MSERPNASAASGLKLAPRPGRAPCDAWTPRARREPRARRAKCGRKHVNFREARQVSGKMHPRGRFVYPLQMRKKGKTLSSVFDSVSTARFERAFHRRFPVFIGGGQTRRDARAPSVGARRACANSARDARVSPRPLSVVVLATRGPRWLTDGPAARIRRRKAGGYRRSSARSRVAFRSSVRRARTRRLRVARRAGFSRLSGASAREDGRAPIAPR